MCAADCPRPRGRRPPGAGSRSQVSAADRAARAIEAGRVCAQRRTYPVTAPGGAHLPQHRTEHRGHHHQWRLEHVANPSGLPASPTRACFRARARAHVRVQRSFGPTHLCAGARGGHHHSATQCQHMTHAASRSAAPPTPRSARRGARASTRATHESARRMDRARPRARARPPREGGPAGSARPTARAPAARLPRKKIQNYHHFPYLPPLGEKKVHF